MDSIIFVKDRCTSWVAKSRDEFCTLVEKNSDDTAAYTLKASDHFEIYIDYMTNHKKANIWIGWRELLNDFKSLSCKTRLSFDEEIEFFLHSLDDMNSLSQEQQKVFELMVDNKGRFSIHNNLHINILLEKCTNISGLSVSAYKD